MDERRRSKTSSSLASGSSSLQSLQSARPGSGASRAWHEGLAGRQAEAQAAVQDYRKRLLKSLDVLSDAARGISLLPFACCLCGLTAVADISNFRISRLKLFCVCFGSELLLAVCGVLYPVSRKGQISSARR